MKPALFTIIFSFVYGMADELHQLIIPGRSCELLDLISDFIGVIIGVIVVSILIKLNNYRLEGT
jgi:VanZ family protein